MGREKEKPSTFGEKHLSQSLPPIRVRELSMITGPGDMVIQEKMQKSIIHHVNFECIWAMDVCGLKYEMVAT